MCVFRGQTYASGKSDELINRAVDAGGIKKKFSDAEPWVEGFEICVYNEILMICLGLVIFKNMLKICFSKVARNNSHRNFNTFHCFKFYRKANAPLTRKNEPFYLKIKADW